MMGRKQITMLCLCLLLTNAVTAQTQAPDKIRRQIEKIGFGGNVTVYLNSGAERYGAITAIATDQFEIAEVDLQQKLTIPFAEVKKIRRGYGQKRNRFGNRIHPRTSLIVSVAVIGGLMGLAFWGATQTR